MQPALPCLALKKTHISALRQNFKNPLCSFFGINMKSLYAKFQLSSFKTEGGSNVTSGGSGFFKLQKN